MSISSAPWGIDSASSGPVSLTSLNALIDLNVLEEWKNTKYEVNRLTITDPEPQKVGIQTHFTYAVSFNATGEKKGVRADGKYESLPNSSPSVTENDLVIKGLAVRRRYSDFVWLRATLRNCFPGLFLPLLPPKKLFGNKEHGFIQKRCRALQNFLRRLVSRHQFMARSKPFTIFVTKHNEEFIAAKKQLDKDLKTVYTEPRLILEMYKRVFGAPQGEEDTSFAIPKDPSDLVHFMRTFLSDTLVQTQIVIDSTRRISAAYAAISDQAFKMHANLVDVRNGEAVISDNEAKHRPDHSGRVSFRKRVEQLADEMDTKKKNVEVVHKDAGEEYLDTKAMLEVVKQWQGMNKTLDYLMRSTKDRDVELREPMIDLVKIITHNLFNVELDFYWKNKISRFEESHSQFAKEQVSSAERLKKIWNVDNEES